MHPKPLLPFFRERNHVSIRGANFDDAGDPLAWDQRAYSEDFELSVKLPKACCRPIWSLCSADVDEIVAAISSSLERYEAQLLAPRQLARRITGGLPIGFPVSVYIGTTSFSVLGSGNSNDYRCNETRTASSGCKHCV